MQSDKKIEEWKAIIEEQVNSGLSKTKFCQQKNINEARFYYYQKMIANAEIPSDVNQDKVDLIPIKIKEATIKNSKDMNIKIVMKNGMDCILPIGIDNKRLQEILRILMSC